MTYTGDSLIATKGRASAAGIQAWFEENAAAGAAYVELPEIEIPAGTGGWVVEFSEAWNVNADMLAALCGHESAWFQSKICREKNNPGGYGAENDDPYNKAITFPTLREGIRAVAAHLAGYVHGTGAWNAYSPRHPILVSKGWDGSVKKLTDLNGKWAWPGKTYGQSLARIANDLLSRIKENDPPMSAQIPGYVWHPASTTHYTRGRTVPVSGGAQHYSAGTNSLDWLTKTSGGSDPRKRVSAHFLVKHNPTMDDRGWQLVRMEDTAWTTAFANPYTVSIEYEHTGKGDIPDIAYDVLIQTWKDIAAYVKSKGLGEIEKIAGHKEWVNNPALVCPDGIAIERIRKGVAGSPGQPPSVPPARDLPTVPDPWGSNYWIPRLFVDEIKRHDWMTVGHCKSGAFLEGRKIVQYFERARLELNEDGTVTRGLVGAEVYDHRYPNGAP